MDVSVFNDPVFRRFATQRPVATAVQLILRRMLLSDCIDQLFRDNAQLQYERTLLFSGVTKLMASVVLGQNPSVNAAHKKMANELGVSNTALYNKLQRIEPNTSRSLVQRAYDCAVEINKAIGGVKRNDLPGYSTRILDGNHLGKTEHRIKETRDLVAGPLPGKSLVVYDPRYDCVCDFIPIEDGHAQEISVIDEVIETLQRSQLWIGDRNFCILRLLYTIAEQSSCFIVRQHGKLKGTVKGKERKIGNSATGTVYENQLVLPCHDGKTIVVRRVVVHLNTPTRDGDYEIVLLTNLPLEDASAVTISDLYRDRWKIETMFLHLTLHLGCEIKALCYPAASLFCFAVSLLGYNSLSVVKAMIAAEHGRSASEQLSHYYMACEIAQTLEGMLIAIADSAWETVNHLPLEDFARELLKISASADMQMYRKSVRGAKKPPPKKKGNKRTVHVSTKRILDKRN